MQYDLWFVSLIIKISVGVENLAVDTMMIRQCMSHYVENIYGFITDDFDYSKVYYLKNNSRLTN
jgi:hypothetical protein